MTALQAVVDGLAIAPGGDDAVAAQESQVLRSQGLAHAEHLGQRAHRLLTIDQGADDHQPMRVRQRLQQGARIIGRGLESSGI